MRENAVVWVSALLHDTRNFAAFEGVEPDKDMPALMRVKALNESGRPLVADAFFTTTRAKTRRAPKLSDLMLITDGFVLVSARLMAVLSRFDLVDGGFHATRLLAAEGDTQLANGYAYWNFGNHKKTFVPDQSPAVTPSLNGPDKSQPTSWFPPASIRDHEITLSAQGCAGPDVWTEWRLRGCVFFSDPLVQALRDADLDAPFGFRACRIV
ncbi:hypothetical protein [Pseudoponticoccus marisrubri]|uniref:Uncharacterized protein n=1 Tax=Pseudoponticoccus marisrubri TaxID=1685382 RepID=A0A0W7WKN0_9RHOB|nr:hypothetical protein [Pseudoponticoccus marisrubri]KUF11154.1 hypothetical protein AVJ23_08860 [Pseudoponticoccus marisrubri]